MNKFAVGIQGHRGAFHEQAAHQMFGEEVELAYIATFDELFDSLKAGNIGTAVAAIANVTIGFIDEPYEELVKHGPESYWASEETYVPVAHQLLGLPGANIDQIKVVHSMVPALRQCAHTLRRLVPDAHLVEEEDTALSAEIVRELDDPTHAAVASKVAGKLNGLEVLQLDIQDAAKNMTRFLAIKRRNDGIENMDGTEDKSTVLLTTPDSRGALYKALGPFDAEDINIDTLHSSFVQDTYFDARFFMEFDAGLQSPRSERVLQALVQQGCDIQTLGSYHKQPIPILNQTDGA